MMNKKAFITLISIVISISAALYMTNVFETFGLHISAVSYFSFILGLVLTMVFMTYPIKKGMSEDKTCWHDLLFIILSLVSTFYIVFFPELREEALTSGISTNIEIVMCFMLVIAILEATRRMVNTTMAIIAAFFVAHLLVGSYLPGPLATFSFSLQRITTLFYFSPNGIFGLPVSVAFTIVVAFMFFGAILKSSGAASFITDFAFALTGRWTGGPAKAAIVGSSLLGTLEGATVANVVTTGTITIPLMKQNGFSANVAGAVECCASNGAQIMPPVMGIVAFMIAEVLGVPYVSVCIAAIFPALLYYLALFTQVHFHSAKMRLHGLPADQLPSIKKVLKDKWFYVIPVFVLIYALVWLHLPVQHCGLYAALSAIVVTIIDFQRKKETRKNLKGWVVWFIEIMESTAKDLLVPAMACASAGIVIGSIDTSGFGFKLSSMLVNLAGGNLFFLLLLTAVSSFILGMGMSSVPCYLVLAILVAPAMVKAGVAPMAAHLFVFYWGIMSFITPPVAVAAYVAASISKGDPMKTGYIAMRLAFVSYVVPFVFVYNPGLLLDGSWSTIILSIITATTGVIAIAIGFEGFLAKRLTFVERLFFITGGTLVFAPTTKVSGWFDVIGFIIILFGIMLHTRRSVDSLLSRS
ncbi:MAG: TRAP transporter fused permease subunit [Syntrophorhabdaceae bacterium]|nr:TRAP transporter fused permease subunit [Syntrophorhabdaceae bacterium]MDD5242795.1 TRAP transporter fused permease subunit [Syntrophorhabdaceae bacterium]